MLFAILSRQLESDGRSGESIAAAAATIARSRGEEEQHRAGNRRCDANGSIERVRVRVCRHARGFAKKESWGPLRGAAPSHLPLSLSCEPPGKPEK